jgi:hypothetical protein
MQFLTVLAFKQTWKHFHSMFFVNHKIYLVVLLTLWRRATHIWVIPHS